MTGVFSPRGGPAPSGLRPPSIRQARVRRARVLQTSLGVHSQGDPGNPREDPEVFQVNPGRFRDFVVICPTRRTIRRVVRARNFFFIFFSASARCAAHRPGCA